MSVPKLHYVRLSTLNGAVLNSNSVMLTGSRIATDNRGWRARMKAGYQAGSPYTTSRYDVVLHQDGIISSTEQYFDNAGVGQNFRELNHIGVYFGVDTAFNHYQGVTSAQENEALTNLYSKIRQESSGANGLLVLAELRETLHMLRHPAEALRKMTGTLINDFNIQKSKVKASHHQRKGETTKSFLHRRREALVKGFSGTWLEYQFGVKPFISDVNDLATTAYRHITSPSKRKRVTSRSTLLQSVQNYNEVETIISANVKLYSVELRSGSSGVQYIVGLEPIVVGPDRPLLALSQSFGLTIENFVPTVYEIIPWSFLIDYFSNLGDVISAATTSTAAVKWVVRTQRQLTTYGVISTRAEPISPKVGIGIYRTVDFKVNEKVLGRSIVSLTSIERTCPSTIPIPSLQLEIPGISSSKWLNMVALLGTTRSSSMRF